MAAQRGFDGGGHGYFAAFGDARGFETFVGGEAEQEGASFGEAAFELLEDLGDAPVGEVLFLYRVLEGAGGRLLGEFCDVVGPAVFGADAEPGDAFQAVAEHCAAVVGHGAGQVALVVVDE